MKKIYVNCGGELQVFDNKKQVMDFYEDCIMMSEGSERERYTEIYFSVKSNLNTNKRCFTDGTDHVYNTKLKPEDIDYEDEILLYKNYGVDKKELLFYQAKNYLANSHERIFKSTYDRYSDIDDLYKDYLSNKSEDTFYYFDEDKIICIDTSATSPDNYWVEEFSLEDFEYADKWLKGEIEYDEYLDYKNDQEKYSLNKIKVKDMLGYVLEDDDTSTGGLSSSGETLKDFVDEDLDELNLGDSLETSIFWINDRLKACGIKEITEEDCKQYLNSINKEEFEL